MGELTSNGHKIVDGVLKSNIDIRNKHLSRNNGKYSLFEGEFDNAIGAAVDIKTRTLSDIKGGMTLYDYTSDKKTPLGEKIQNTYFNNNAEKELYSILNPSPSELLRWNGKYDNYIKYVSEVYGKEYTVIRLIDELFADLDITYAMNLTKVGVVKDINVPLALAGVNTTNINNYSGTDTRLGRLTNQIYASKLYQASVFNSSRGTKYITPSLSAVYGNNLQNLARLSDIMVPNPKNGRIEDFEQGKYLLRIDDLKDNANNGQYEYIPTAVTNHTEYVVTGATFSLEDKLFDGLKITVSNVDVINKKSSPPKDYFIYQDASGLTVDNRNNEWETFHLSGDTKTLGGDIGKKNLLSATQNLFSQGKIDTMIGRYYLDGRKYKSSVIDTAIDDLGSRSHGRNLLKKDAKIDRTGNDNPYCRTWTFRNQYKKIENQIRPFDEGNQSKLNGANKPYRANGDGDYLTKNTVLNLNNGRVNVAPSKNGNVDIKKCMFSIENLAWKDVLKPGKNLSKEQIGPSGGRIMWFPPYGLDFSESVNVNWDNNTFIGRGEDVYTYKNTTRSANLSFILLIDHPSLLNSMRGSKNTEDSDILRFFAGCDVPNLSGATQNPTEATPNASNEWDWDTDNGKYIEVSVYFPNNYSGNGETVDRGEWRKYENKERLGNEYGCSDAESWINYILNGRNAKGFWAGNGYEIGDRGITDLNSDSETSKNEYILACDKTSAWTKCAGEKSNNNKYWYRVDFDLRQNGIDGEDKKYKVNYQDIGSFKLNSQVETKNENVFSFKDFRDYIISYTGGTKNSELATILSGSSISKVEVRGVATLQDEKNSDMLAERRAMTLGCTVMKWFNQYHKSLGIDLPNNVDFKRGLLKGDETTKTFKSINEKVPKKNRRATVRIYYNKSEVTDASVPEGSGSGRLGSGNTNISNAVVNKKGEGIPPSSQTASTVAYNAIEVTPNRYESESDFFDKLKRTEPVIWKHIKDKIRYFDPAYHSISPEGFNARLTFLQQCTRQGHTISATENDGSAMTAGNLAFGRMPVCVLRIGDFIHTKIVITSLSINYSVSNGMQWDMNEEGAGVQPMMAKVTITFNIIGGQSLEAPINRLQNAVSFNYYANAGVYDDRADKAHLQDEKLIYDNLFTVNKK